MTLIVECDAMCMQVVIIQIGGPVFFTVALSLDQWLWSLTFGVGILLYSQVSPQTSLSAHNDMFI